MWHGLLKIVEIQHVDKDGKILWQEKNLYNTLHSGGQQFILNAMFVGGPTSQYIPLNYYFGLDNRTTVALADTMSTVQSNGEPSSGGYTRQVIPSTGQFTVTAVGSTYQAASPIISFSCTSSWGPVSNLFMTDQTGYTGTLISSAALSETISLTTGQAINMKMLLSLQDV